MLRGKVDPKKEEQDRLQGFLLDMLKEEENKYCADCQAKTPRWAAWNLGVFICIRCAGIHRNLGVHISKVRSVNLDSWTAEQVQTMRVMGNEKARQVYECDIPAQFRRPTNDQQMEQFIRSKYEQKRYMRRDFVYPKVDVADLPKTAALAQKKGGTPVVSITARGNTVVTSNGVAASAAAAPSLLDFSDPPASSTPAKQAAPSLFDDFNALSLQNPSTAAPVAPTASDDFDDFGSFVSASSSKPAAPSASLNEFAAFAAALPPSTDHETPAAPSSGLDDLSALSAPESESSSGKKTNADILSLFGTSGGLPAPNVVAPGGFAGFGLQAAPQVPQPAHIPQQNAFANFGAPAHPQMPQMTPAPQNDMFGGLSGLNFGPPATQAPPQNFGASFGTLQSQMPSMQSSYSAKPTPTSPTGSQGFNIPNKSNAFADLALGKVMKTNYGQSALHSQPPPVSRTSPLPTSSFASSAAAVPSATANNDLFDMFSSVPPPVPVTVNSSSGLDDLLGL